ncbi:hypothetical protein L228DRAFT_247840 [Xylona heveae TC161]|uniref:Uncharacterized protein n=1 Tax=Xylona heveae (strain CBS 132557 / TC161) TaxID=1328760 RepID=A0A165GI24_XYLHT|nr:hypothetical protein L228DRAFT_247840 [Xylona heveae TC161]KZF22208.1 hypothetical protein L228DRAFT_247840 [Xylona heveae TC161]
MDHQDPAVKCTRALFLSTASFGVIVGLISLTVLLVLVLTTILRFLIKSYPLPSSTTPSEASTPPSSTDRNEPPPYSEQTPSTAAKQRSTAESFVLGTFLLLPLLVALVTLALCIQNIRYCPTTTSTAADGPSFASVISWILYSLLALYASSGLVTWVILLRNLWLHPDDAGAPAPIPQDVVPLVLIGAVLLPPVMVGRGSVVGVRWLQARFCPDTLIEVPVQSVELDQRGLLDGDKLHGSRSPEYSERTQGNVK